MVSRKIVQAAEAYFTELRLVRASGGATDERSLYVPLANLLNTVGSTLKPKVFCVQELADQGAGHPDFGLYSTRQVQDWPEEEKGHPTWRLLNVIGEAIGDHVEASRASWGDFEGRT